MTEAATDLADAGVADEEELEEVVVSAVRSQSAGGCNGGLDGIRLPCIGSETLYMSRSAQSPAKVRYHGVSGCGGGRVAEATYYSGFMMAAVRAMC